MPDTPTRARPRRADAERNVQRIEDAAIEALASAADVSMAQIARRAGVARATVYMHFPTREALVEAVTRRAIGDAAAAMAAAEPERGEADAALRRVVAAAWRSLGRFHALVAINVQLPPAELRRRHGQVIAQLAPLIERGQRSGAFRDDVPASWHLSMILALVHAASAELRAGRLDEADAEAAVAATVSGALARR
jgi:AcrR family transcriptional regulator